MLSCARYQVTLEALEPLDLPSYLGSTLRGAFGHEFRDVACRAPRGLDCPTPSQCPYHLIFETSPRPGSEALRTHEEVPRPFIISPIHSTAIGHNERQHFKAGENVRFELILVGRAQEFFPYFVIALRAVNRIGRGRRAVELRSIEALTHDDASSTVYTAAENLVRGVAPSINLEDCAATPTPEGPVTIEFLTQTRLKQEGRFARRPDFQILFRRLLGRLSSLSRFHCGTALEVNFRELIDDAKSIHLTKDDTGWTRWQRYSSRQQRRMEWEGIVGRATYRGDFSPFWKFLKFGELIHVGHGATFGLGKYRIVRSSEAEA